MEYLEGEFLVTEPTSQLRKFIHMCLPTLESSQEILTYLINLAGQEIEGEEISLGVVVTPHPKDVPLPLLLREASLSQSVFETTNGIIDFKSHAFDPLRKAIHTMRQSVLGWVPGQFEQPVLVLDSKTLAIRSVRILAGTLNAHDAYRKLTRIDDTFAFWVKPHRSIRFYHDRRFVGQIMALRDASGWAARRLDVLATYIRSRTTGSTGELQRSSIRCFESRKILEEKVLYPLIELSEEKRGAGLYFMSEIDWSRISPSRSQTRFTHTPLEGDTIRKIGKQELSTYLRQDGSVVFNTRGRLRALGNYFLGPGTGGRRATAKAIVSEYDCSALVVSQDGALLFYSEGIPWDERHQIKDDSAENNPYLRLDFFPPGLDPKDLNMNEAVLPFRNWLRSK